MSKPKVGFYWCASCGGCEEAVVDLAEDVLTVVDAVDIVFWPCAMDFKREDVEKMQDKEFAVSFVNGAIRTSEQEEMAHLMRRKSGLLVAFGSCSHMGGIPSLGNQFDKATIFGWVYNGSQSTDGNGTVPQESTKVPEGTLTLPSFYDTVKTLDQVVDVDYYLPGCPPPVKLIVGAVMAILEGKLPPKGTVLAPDRSLCDECPQKDNKPEEINITAFKRPHQIIAEPDKCLLDQGLLCMGPVTRAGCEAACVQALMPCTGCMGPTSRVHDFGAKALSSLASIVEYDDEAEAEKALNDIVDPVGSFYRYSLAASLLFRKIKDE
jgi:F420-non-reducing hydrogenase small subunit